MVLQVRTEILFNRIPDIERAIASGVPAVVGKVVADGEALAKQGIREYGAIDTGNMLNNVGHSHANGAPEGEVFSNAPYSGFVDQGTWRMSARPFFTGMVEQLRVTFPKAIEALMKGLH